MRIDRQILIEHRTQLSSSAFNQAAILLYDRNANTTKVQSCVFPAGMINRSVSLNPKMLLSTLHPTS